MPDAFRIMGAIWDSNTVPTSGGLSLALGSVPRNSGTSIWAASGTKTISDTWFQQQNQLGQGYALKCMGVAIYWDDAAAPADKVKCWRDGVMFLKVRDTEYFKLPLDRITGGSGASGFAVTTASTTTISYAANGVPDPRAVWSFMPDSFDVVDTNRIDWWIEYSAAPAPTAAVKFRAYLLGELTRIL